MSNKALLDELYRQIQTGTIKVNLHLQGQDWAQVTIRTVDGYQFDTIAHRKPIEKGA